MANGQEVQADIEPHFDNKIMVFLYRIADFQVY